MWKQRERVEPTELVVGQHRLVSSDGRAEQFRGFRLSIEAAIRLCVAR